MNPEFLYCTPTDVKFWFKDLDGSVKEVKARKQMLSAASDVFYRSFYGALKSEEEIEISDARQEVFLAMIEYIYNKAPDFKHLTLVFSQTSTTLLISTTLSISGIKFCPQSLSMMLPRMRYWILEFWQKKVLSTRLCRKHSMML